MNAAQDNNIDSTLPESEIKKALIEKFVAAAFSGKCPWKVGESLNYAKSEIDEEKLPEHKRFLAHGKSADAYREALRKSAAGTTVFRLVDGAKANMLNEEHTWIQYARALNMPLKAGVSGTTARLMNCGKDLGERPLNRVRLMALGHLLPIGAHSFHEIMSAARSFEGCTYTDGNYRNIAPLDWNTELKPLWEKAEKKVKGGNIRKGN